MLIKNTNRLSRLGMVAIKTSWSNLYSNKSKVAVEIYRNLISFKSSKRAMRELRGLVLVLRENEWVNEKTCYERYEYVKRMQRGYLYIAKRG